ncbi:MAG: ExbD/TolR family protein [Limisphaerales bacterium]
MKFSHRKRRGAPAVIIVSLIDVLMVVLIFLVATTTFKQQPAMELTLPESTQSEVGESSDRQPFIIDITKAEPHLFYNGNPISIRDLKFQMTELRRTNDNPIVALRSDEVAPVGILIKVTDAAKEAGLTGITMYTRQPN